jgi:hypothetical protein
MGIGRVLGAVAPIAAGYFGGPALAGAFGSATGGAIAAGALTGAGIAALSNQDILGGAVTGGLGGLSGGAMGTAAQATKAAEAAKLAQAGAPTGAVNSALYSTSAGTFNPALQSTFEATRNLPPLTGGANIGTNIAGSPALQTGFKPTVPMPQGPDMGFVGQTQTVAGGGGYNPSAFGRGIEDAQAAFREPGEFLSQLGDGSKAMGAGKLGLTGLGVAGQAGAFDPEPIKLSDSRDKYDPNARLDLSMDTGIDEALKRDTGLRLLAQGGEVKKFVLGGKTESEYTPEQLTKLEAYGVVPQYKAPQMYGMGAFANSDKYKTAQYRNPVTGIVDVGGKFVATPKGDITDVDYVKNYKYILEDTTAEKNQQGGMDPNLMPKGTGNDTGANTGALAAIASGFAQQQMNPPTKSQTLGLEALAGGGYLETGGEVGDGMSDEIEATIEGEQEARLSDGEFVIPADVVSHLGNGSSDAGAKRLYEMMDKIRMARTGTKKQGKEINPERYMPA